MEEFIISKDNFKGLNCIWGRDEGSPITMNSLTCYVPPFNYTKHQNKVK